MKTYKYSAISKSGKKVSGVIEGFDELDAVARIKQTCDIVLKITVVEEKTGILNMEIGGNKLNKKAFTVMCSQFAIILRSGISMSRTVQLIADKTTDKNLKKILKKVAQDVEAGRRLSDSFADRGGNMFPPIFLETVRAGEESGNVDRAFEKMYQHYDKQSKMVGKVKNALTYPVFVIVVAIVVVIVLMVKVVPTFTSIFDEYGSELPLITRMLIAVSNFFRKYIFLLLAISILLFIAYKVYTSTEGGKINMAKLSLQIPVMGNIQSLNAASEFANNLTTLLGSGLQITKAIQITARVLGNYYISQEIGKMVTKLEAGGSLGAAMRESGCLPDILIDMVAVGEETGELESTLNTIAGYYDAELEVAIQNALNKLEPTVLVFIAGVAGFIVLAVYIAMFNMYSLM